MNLPSESPAPTRRRWFRFSLRALFLGVAIFGGWLTWNLYRTHQVIDHRDYAIERIRVRGGHVREIDYSRNFDGTPKEMPWQFSRAGARPVMRIELPKDRFTAADRQYAEELFPEADVAWMTSKMTGALPGINAKLRNQGYVLKSPEAPSNGTPVSLREDTEGFYKSWN